MTAAGDMADTQKSFPGARGYKLLPWLVVYGYGPDAEQVAERIAEHCAAEGVIHAEVRAVDEVDATSGDLASFAVLVLVVPASTTHSQAMKLQRMFDKMVLMYRHLRRSTLQDALTGRQTYVRSGVIQVVVVTDDPSRPKSRALASLLEKACVERQATPGQADGLPDLFSALDGLAPPLLTTELPARRSGSAEQLWSFARSWGITTADEVYEIFAMIDDERKRFRQSRFNAVGSRHPDYPGLAALDLVLDVPKAWDTKPPGMPTEEYEAIKANFKITTGRAVRLTIARIQRDFPNFARADGRSGTRENRPAFRLLYITLDALRKHLDENGTESFVNESNTGH